MEATDLTARRIALALRVHRTLNGADTDRADLTHLRRDLGRTALPAARTDLPARLTDTLWQRRSGYRFAARPLDPGDLSIE